MSVLESIQTALAGATGDQNTLERINSDKLRRQKFADSQRQAEIQKYMGVSNNIHKHLALLMNPDTMTPLPGKEQEVASLQQNLSQVDAYVKNLYNPGFDFNKGAMVESPIHKLGDKLHLT